MSSPDPRPHHPRFICFSMGFACLVGNADSPTIAHTWVTLSEYAALRAGMSTSV